MQPGDGLDDVVERRRADYRVLARPVPGTGRAASAILDGMRILVVDDEAVFADGVRISVGEPEADDHIVAAAVDIQALQ